jgi:hypothetical protein
VKNDPLKESIRVFLYEGLLPETFPSKKLKKGVYYNPYFTIDTPDPEGQIIFPTIMLLQCKAESNY